MLEPSHSKWTCSSILAKQFLYLPDMLKVLKVFLFSIFSLLYLQTATRLSRASVSQGAHKATEMLNIVG